MSLLQITCCLSVVLFVGCATANNANSLSNTNAPHSATSGATSSDASRTTPNGVVQSAFPIPVAQAVTSVSTSALPALPPPIFMAPSALRIADVLPAYPLANSPADAVDLLVVRGLQTSRSAADIAEAEKLAALNARVFLSHLLPKLGRAFDEAKYTRTIVLLDQIQSDMRGINRAANDIFAFRTRPAGRAPDIQPALPPGRFVTSSYPSANASTLYVWADVLGQMAPAQRNVIDDVVNRAAWLRVVSGLHFPSDLVGSRAVSTEAWRVLSVQPAFRAALEEARLEFTKP